MERVARAIQFNQKAKYVNEILKYCYKSLFCGGLLCSKNWFTKKITCNHIYFTFSLILCESSSTCTFLPTIGIISLFNLFVVIFRCSLTYISLTTIDLGCLFISLFAIATYFLVKRLNPFDCFVIGFSCYWVLRVLYMLFMSHIICKYFYSICYLSFHSLLTVSFEEQKILIGWNPIYQYVI